MAGNYPGDILPYANPDYWGGHSIGYGEPTSPLPYTTGNRKSLSDSKNILKARLALMERVIPIETFGEGKIFDALDYELGSLVLFRQETLKGDTNQIDIDPAELKSSTMPQRPNDVSPDFGIGDGDIEVIKDGGITYATTAVWGVVGRDRKHGRVLHTVATGLVSKFGGGRVIVPVYKLRPLQTPIKIGQTEHYTSKTFESLQRVNILDLVTYGEGEKKKSKIKAPAGRLAFGRIR